MENLNSQDYLPPMYQEKKYGIEEMRKKTVEIFY